MSSEELNKSVEETQTIIRVLDLMLIEARKIDNALEAIADKFLISKQRIVEIVNRRYGKDTEVYEVYKSIFHNYNSSEPLVHCYCFNTILKQLLMYGKVSREDVSMTKDFIIMSKMEFRLGAKTMFRPYLWDDRILALETILKMLRILVNSMSSKTFFKSI